MPSSLVRQWRLAAALLELRKAAKLSIDELSRRSGVSKTKISRAETNVSRATVSEVIAISDALELDDKREAELVKLCKESFEPGWWDGMPTAMGKRQRIAANLEEGASNIRLYQPLVVHGLLQTEEYARVRIDQARVLQIDKADFKRVLWARMTRQRMVLRPDGPTVTALLEESMLRRPTAPPEVMRDQFARLVELVRTNPSVTLRVVPAGAALADYVAPPGPFDLYGYDDPADPDVAFCEGVFEDGVVSGLSHPRHVATLIAMWGRLEAIAWSVEKTLKFLDSLRDGQGHERHRPTGVVQEQP